MRLRPLHVLCSIFLVLLTLTSVHATNLIANGDFSEGLDGWNVFSDVPSEYYNPIASQEKYIWLGVIGDVDESTNPVAYWYCWKNMQTPAVIGLHQDLLPANILLSNVPDCVLTGRIRITLKNGINCMPAFATVVYSLPDSGRAIKTITLDTQSTTSWQSFSWNLKNDLPQNALLTDIWFGGKGSLFAAEIDDINLSVPEPASVLCILTGLISIAFRKRY